MTGSWKTTLCGLLLAIGIAVQPLLTTGKLDLKQIGIAALVALIGYFAQDKGVKVPEGMKDNGFKLVKK